MIKEGPPDLEMMIGQTVEIDPQQLINRKRLFTSQNYELDPSLTKLGRAIMLEANDPEDLIPSGWVFYDRRGQECFVVGDGNHRIGMAAINRDTIKIKIVGKWDDSQRKWGFNKIVRAIRSELKE